MGRSFIDVTEGNIAHALPFLPPFNNTIGYIWRPMKMAVVKHLISIIFILIVFQIRAQDNAFIYGVIQDSLSKVMPGVTVGIAGTSKGTSSKADGSYELKIPAGIDVRIVYSFVGFESLAAGCSSLLVAIFIVVSVAFPVFALFRLDNKTTC